MSKFNLIDILQTVTGYKGIPYPGASSLILRENTGKVPTIPIPVSRLQKRHIRTWVAYSVKRTHRDVGISCPWN